MQADVTAKDGMQAAPGCKLVAGVGLGQVGGDGRGGLKEEDDEEEEELEELD